MSEESATIGDTSFTQNAERHFAQVAQIEDFLHLSFHEEDEAEGVTKIVGTRRDNGTEDTYAYSFDDQAFTLGDVQVWLGERKLTPINVNPSERSRYPQTSAGAKIQIHAPLTLKAEATRQPTVDILAYTGGIMSVGGFGKVCIDLAGMEIPDQFPLLANHENELDSILGSGTGMVVNGELQVTGVLAGNAPAVATILDLNSSGVQLSASVGAEPLKQRRVLPGEKIYVNGQNITADDYGFSLIEKSRLREVSILPCGADSETTVSIAAKLRKGTLSMSETIEQIRAAAVIETGRVNTIQAAAAKHKAVWSLADHASKRASLAGIEARAISEGWPSDKAELELLRAARPEGVNVNTRGNTPGGAIGNGQIIEAAFLLHMGQERLATKEYGEHAVQAAADLQCRHVLDVMACAMRMSGQDVPNSPHELCRAAFEPMMMKASPGLSTISLPGTLSNLANKMLLQGYKPFPSVARTVARVLSVKDFKQASGMRVTGDATLEKIGAYGEIPHGYLDESVFAYRIETFAKSFGISRQDIINDDLGAFAETPLLIGRGAAQAFESAFWKMVLANGNVIFNNSGTPAPFYSSDNGNLITGTTSALSIASLGAAVSQMMKQTDKHGYPIACVPRYLLVPPELKATADALYRTTTVISGEGNAEKITPNANTFFGLYEPAVSPYLSNAKYPGHSDKAWYLLADPGDVSGYGVAYLNGQQTPTIESGQQTPDVLGIYWRAFFDFGVCAIDPRGAILNTGVSA